MGFDYRDKKSILIIILIFIFLKYINQGFQDEQAEISSNQPEILQVREEDGELIYNGPTGEYQNVWHPENKLHVCLQDLEIRSTYVDNLQHKKNKHSLSAFKSGAIVPNDKVIEVEEDDPSIQDPEPIIVYEEVEVYEPLPNVQSFTASAASASTRSQNEIQLEGELDYIKSSNPCSSEPADSIQGLTPPTDCQIKNSQGKYSIFKETRPKGVPNVVNLVDGNGQIGPNIFPHYEITKDPKIELKSCALMDPAPCRLFDEVKPSWNLIEDDTYSKIVNLQDNSYHTSAIQTLATMEKLQCNMRGQLIIKIQARDHMGRDKKYGGDLIIARMVDKTKFPDYDEYKNLKAGILGHEFFLSDKKGVKRSKFYGETIYAGHTVDNQDGTYKILIPCSAAGSFRLQVFLLQTAEAMTATNHMFRTLNAKGTIKNQDSKSCSSFISDQLPGGNPANVCQVKNDLLNGFSWFCPGPSGTCSMESASYESNNMVSDLAEDLGLLETSEELILKRDVLIFKNRDPKPAPSHNKVAGNVLLGAWTDRILLAYANRATSMESIVEALSTKTIVALGDSVLKQMWEVFFNDVYEYIEGKVGKGAKRRRKRRETTLNIDDLYIGWVVYIFGTFRKHQGNI